jgi:hypothetical protein
MYLKTNKMKYTANRNINLSKNQGRILKGQEVTILKAISTTKTKLVQIITSNNISFRTTQGIANKYFTLNN